MIQTRIIDALFGGVGFRNPSDEEYLTVDEDNTASESGLYFDDISSLVNSINIQDCQPNSGISEDDFNTHLKRMQEGVINEVANDITNGKTELLESINLFPYEKKFDDTLEVGGRFVGFEIDPQNISNILARIDFIEFAFDQDISLNIHLYNSNKKDPILTKECECKGGESTIVKLTNWVISDSETYKGGKFYLGYFEKDLDTVKPYAKNWEQSNLTSGIETSRQNLIYVNSYLGVNLVSLELKDDWFDVSSRIYTPDSFGLNIGINIYSDFTETIIRNKDMVYPLIQLKMAEKVLNLIKYTIRSNRVERFTKDMIEEANFEIYGNKDRGIDGIDGKYSKMLKSVRKSIFPESPIVIGSLK